MSRPREVPGAVFEAFMQMRTGLPRPVLIEMPPEAGVDQEEFELRNPARTSRIVPSPQTSGRPLRLYRNPTHPGYTPVAELGPPI